MEDSAEQRSNTVPEVEVHAHQSDDGSFELIMTDTGRMNAAPRVEDAVEGAGDYHALGAAEARVMPRGRKRLAAIALGVLLVGGLVLYVASSGGGAGVGEDLARARDASDGFRPYREGGAAAASAAAPLKARDLNTERQAPEVAQPELERPVATDDKGFDNAEPSSAPGWELDELREDDFVEPQEPPQEYPEKLEQNYKYEPEPERVPEPQPEAEPEPEEEFLEEEPESWQPEGDDESVEEYLEEEGAQLPIQQGTRRLMQQPTFQRSAGRLGRNVERLAPAGSNIGLDRINPDFARQNLRVGQPASEVEEGADDYYPEDEPYLDEE